MLLFTIQILDSFRLFYSIAVESPSYAPGHDANAPGAFAYTAGSGTPGTRIDPDPEIMYMESRTKYFYFRDRLTKEVKARAHALPSISVAPLQAPYAANNIYSTPPPNALQYTVQQFCPTFSHFS
ncbi:hypothetical protein X798_07253 [Onchocerca flexuosa]|uniref:Uncharacterized protein n=1 Tax=Onchocerca flexuosa TaxID=387005 RepID=A0A238BKL9_9BILA|nr:hypothetical protein X798_07253 [Onchocerca flexuosa]